MGEPFQLFSPEMIRDPFPSYARMREEGLSRVEPGGFWALSRHADVMTALRSPDVFSSAGFVQAFEPPWIGHNPGAHTMLSLDPPAHTQLRDLVSRAFLAPVLERVRPEIEAIARAAVGRFAERGEVDVVEELAVPMSAGAIGRFLTLDTSRYSQLKEWADTIAGITPVPMSPEHERASKAAIAGMTAYVRDVVDERRSRPGDDMVSMLIKAEIDGQKLSDEDLVAFLFLLIIAGIDTTVQLVSKSFLMLSERKDLLADLRRAPGRIPAFIEEMLRYDPPTHSLFRFTARDVDVAGGRIPTGSVVLLMLASANRDPQKFERPDEFNIDRDTQAGVAFGHGPHFCIGAGLARLEARALLEATFAAFTDIELTATEVEVRHTLTVRGPVRVPVRGTPVTP